MSDHRQTLANDRVADIALKGQVTVDRYVTPTAQSVIAPVADLTDRPGGPRSRQMLFGETFQVIETRDGLAFGRAEGLGYVGYADASALSDAPGHQPTHFISARATHAYRDPDMKSPDLMGLSFWSRVVVINETEKFYETNAGFIPRPHLREIGQTFDDPAAVAQKFLGAPYLWGGNTSWGLDCSGLCHLALQACGMACPPDSDQQEGQITPGAHQSNDIRRNDLLFWKGHVAIAMDSDTMIHANAHSMNTCTENIQSALKRIEQQGDGPLSSRLSL